MEEFALESIKELYMQERKNFEELMAKEMEKTLCDMGLELLKNIERPADNPTFTQVAEEKCREFFARRKKARSSASEKYALQKTFVSKIEEKLLEQYGLIPEVNPQGEIQFRRKDNDK